MTPLDEKEFLKDVRRMIAEHQDLVVAMSKV